jgi:threonine synthase
MQTDGGSDGDGKGDGVALKEMGRKGHFVEPTAAATIAGLEKYLRKKRREVVVSTLTGMGLKSPEKML